MALTLRRNIGRRLTHDEMDDNWAGLADLSLTSFVQYGPSVMVPLNKVTKRKGR